MDGRSQNYIPPTSSGDNKPNRCYPLIFVGTVIAAGSMPNLMYGVFQILFSGWAHSFISYVLLVKDEHEVQVFRINYSFWHYLSCLAWM